MLSSKGFLLQTLSLGNCGLRTFPAAIAGLAKLMWCDLGHNYGMVRIIFGISFIFIFGYLSRPTCWWPRSSIMVHLFT